MAITFKITKIASGGGKMSAGEFQETDNSAITIKLAASNNTAYCKEINEVNGSNVKFKSDGTIVASEIVEI